MRKSVYEMFNVKLDELDYAKDFVESPVAKSKIESISAALRGLVNEAYVDNPSNRNACRSIRVNFVKNNPALIDAANKILAQPIGEPICLNELCDDRHFRIVVTFIKSKMPDFRYYTFNTGIERMLVKIAGTPISNNNGDEKFETTF